MISKTAEYAVRAMVALQQHGQDGRLRADQISELTGIPTNYLSKILHALGRVGLVASTRGRNGGFRVAKRTKPITAFEIVDEFDLLTSKRRCFLGNSECSHKTACAAHNQWDRVWTVYEEFLESQTLDKLTSPPPRARARRHARSNSIK